MPASPTRRVFIAMRLSAAALCSVLAGTGLAGWTTDNEAVVMPILDLALAGRCDDTATRACPGQAGRALTHWIGRTAAGNLYLVMQPACASAVDCDAWFIERTAKGVAVQLDIEGRFRIVHNGTPIPDVETWREQADGATVLTRYAWVGGAYLKVDTHTRYRVDDAVCGSALECHEAARAAHARRQTDKALRIWEQVHKISWI